MDDRLVSLIDLMPTILRMADAAIPSAVQGQPLLRRDGTPDDAPQRSHLLIEDPHHRRTYGLGEYRLTWHGAPDRGELYDLQADPDSLHNLWDMPSHASVQRELLNQLVDMLVHNIDPNIRKYAPC
ncbi:MAG: DUF4976 domain-containing protein [Candidatus Competibacteraceae bacterium]|nr:DUF4976 domain-containing protein [Candidatus Competibacteraceae bacterium]